MLRAFGLAAALALAGPAVAADYNLPEFGEPADRSLPLSEERELGAEVYRQLKRRELLLADRELESYVQMLGQSLVDASPEARGESFRFFVIRDASINAFAMPGGYIGVHTGLLKAAQSEAELAAVLAHEIAHVTQRHIARQMDATRGWDLASAALLLAAIAAGGSDPDLAQAAIGLGMGMAYQRQVNFTRAHELEADRLGIQTLANAGYDSQGMEDFFRRLAAQSRLYGEGLPEILRTHPVSTTRMAEAAGRAEALPDGASEQTGLFPLMRVRAELANIDLAADKLRRFPAGLGEHPVAARYGRAIALRARGDLKAAQAAIDEALARSDTEAQAPLLQVERARILYARKQADEARTLLRAVHKAHPGNHAATLLLGEWLLAADRPADARQLLLESEAFSAEVADTFFLLARAASAMDEDAEAQYQLANYQRARGDWAAAIRQLRAALAQRDWEDYARARLEGRLESMLASAPRSAIEELRRKPREPS